MKIAIIGSRNFTISNLGKYLPKTVTEIVLGVAKGIDTCAREYAYNIKLTEFLPEYKIYKKRDPLKRNLQMINYADIVIAFWDGKLNGTRHIINSCKKVIIYKMKV